MFRFNPRGENLRALEQNILKYRTFEMVLILFYVEEIKTLVFKTIPVTGDYRKSYSQKNEQPLKRNKKTQKLLWQLLIDEKILTKDEKEDIKSIIDFRNDIAHSIEELVFDLNVDSLSKSFVELKGKKYEYGVFERLKKYKELIYERISGRYILTMNSNSLLFSQAERTYLMELQTLDRKIRRLLDIRKTENEQIQNEIKALGNQTLERLKPYHPKNFKANGKLSSQGINCLHELFKIGVSNIVISYFMRISLRSINKRKRTWEQINS